MLRCSGEANVTEFVVSTTIRYTHFHWLIYKLKKSRQEVTRTCFKRGCVRSFHERQKQTKSEMKGLILIRLLNNYLRNWVLLLLLYYQNGMVNCYGGIIMPPLVILCWHVWSLWWLVTYSLVRDWISKFVLAQLMSYR